MAAGLVPGARLCPPRVSKAVAGECVLSRKLLPGDRGSGLHGAGDALGKAVQSRGCATGGAGYKTPTKGTTAIGFAEGWQRAAICSSSEPRLRNPWSETKRSYEAALGRAASYVSELAVNARRVPCTWRFSPCGLFFGTPMELAGSN